MQEDFLFVEILEGIRPSLFVGIGLERDYHTRRNELICFYYKQVRIVIRQVRH